MRSAEIISTKTNSLRHRLITGSAHSCTGLCTSVYVRSLGPSNSCTQGPLHWIQHNHCLLFTPLIFAHPGHVPMLPCFMHLHITRGIVTFTKSRFTAPDFYFTFTRVILFLSNCMVKLLVILPTSARYKLLVYSLSIIIYFAHTESQWMSKPRKVKADPVLKFPVCLYT